MARPGEQIRIGEVLKRTRTGKGLDIAGVEERTKIRTKYLRALEGEDWDALPGPAYARGFLRTYAELLGLDAEELVDAFRRQVEPNLEREHSHPFGEPLLEGRPRVGERDGKWGGLAVIVAGLAVVVAVLLATGMIGS